jgi:hypothetical protein
MSEKDNKTKSNRGGARDGAGRPAGSKNKVSKATVQTVLDLLYDKTGRVYEDLLLEDFLQARVNNSNLAMKYHALLSNKLMPDLNSIELTNTELDVDLKAQAFADALAALTQTRDKK